MSNARNAGANISNGEFLAFLDGDDLWLPSKLEVQIKFHSCHPSCVISHTGFYRLAHDHVLREPWNERLLTPHWQKQGCMLPILYWKNVIATLTVMIKRDIFLSLGGFDPSIWGTEDQDLWIRVALNGNIFGFVNKKLALYRVGETSVSNLTGRYKGAKKRILSKHVLHNKSLSRAMIRKAYAYYYRHFGALYLKKGSYKLARLYFLKSLSYECISFLGATTIMHLFPIRPRARWHRVKH